jgi:opacity protein-like surface antigen
MRPGFVWKAVLLVAALLATAALPAPVRAQAAGEPTAAMDGEWHVTLAPYMWFSGIKGDVSVGNLPPIPVDASISDILSNFDFGLEGHFEARKDRFGFAGDFIYSDLGADVAPGVEIVDVRADIRQFITEGFVFYRLASGARGGRVDIFVGARYTGTRARLTAEGPGGVDDDRQGKELSWVDAMGGLRFVAPLGSRFAVLGRGDIAGFGSQFTWNVSGDLAFLASERWTLGAGWRYMDIDYEKDDTVLPERFDLAYNGPRLWFAYSW